jgi:acyl-CoA thioesterase I
MTADAYRLANTLGIMAFSKNRALLESLMDFEALAAENTGLPNSINYLREFSELAQTKWPDNRTLTIVCHGHSVPAGFFKTPEVRTYEAYPHLLHKALKEKYPFAVINVIVTAIGGENSRSGAARFKEDVLALRPDVLLIDYGLNDRGIGLDEAHKAWSQMIQQSQESGAKVILLTPTPDKRSKIEDESEPLNQHAEQIRALAEEFKVALADSQVVFAETIESGVPLEKLMSQVNHPNRRGHELVAHTLLEWF